MYRFEIMFESKATDKSIMRALQSMRFTEYPILFKNDIVLGITLPDVPSDEQLEQLAKAVMEAYNSNDENNVYLLDIKFAGYKSVKKLDISE